MNQKDRNTNSVPSRSERVLRPDKAGLQLSSNVSITPWQACESTDVTQCSSMIIYFQVLKIQPFNSHLHFPDIPSCTRHWQNDEYKDRQQDRHTSTVSACGYSQVNQSWEKGDTLLKHFCHKTLLSAIFFRERQTDRQGEGMDSTKRKKPNI